MIDLLVVSLYFILMLFLGWRNRNQSPEAFWVAERSYSTGRIALSLVATVFGASSTLGLIGLGYSRGLTGAWWSLMGGIALIPFAVFFASRVRRLNVYTLPDVIREAYGQKVAVPAAFMISVAWCGVIAAQLIAGGRLISSLFPISFDAALILVAVVFTLYTFWGGQLSVIKTDFWQLSLFAGGLLVSLLFLISSQMTPPSAWGQIASAQWHFPVSSGFGWYDVLVFYPLIVGLPYLVGPDIYSRVLCARDDKVAQKATVLASALIIPLSFILAVYGILAGSQFPGILPENALPVSLNALVPAGLKGLIVSGFLGAVMSSADTCLLSASTILTLNVLQPFWAQDKRGRLFVTRCGILIFGFLAWFLASSQQGIISSLLLGYTVFVGGVVCPAVAGFFKDALRVTSSGALWAVIMGGSAAIMGKMNGGAMMKALLTEKGLWFIKACLGPQYLSILPVILSALALFAVSRLGKGEPSG